MRSMFFGGVWCRRSRLLLLIQRDSLWHGWLLYLPGQDYQLALLLAFAIKPAWPMCSYRASCGILAL
jgi:hypothetical protein